MPNYLIYLIRTASPILAGWLIAIPAARPILTLLGLSDGTTAAAAIAAVLAAGYAALAHFLERKWPKLGVLLGIPNAPTYTPAKTGFPFDTSDLTQPLTALTTAVTSAVTPTPAAAPPAPAPAPAAPATPPAPTA